MADSFGGTNASVGVGDLVTTLKIANQNTSLLIQTLQAIFPRIGGSFTLSAAATTTIANNNISANSIVLPFPSNAAAAALMGSAKSLYHSANSAGVSFTMATGNGVAAAGTEQFNFVVVNLL